jgi:hypothetical protein
MALESKLPKGYRKSWRGGTCNCGSGLMRRPLVDACGIFCTFVCDQCEPARRARYRSEIFTDPNYEMDEDL